MKFSLKTIERRFRAQADCEEYTAEGRGFALAYGAGKVTLAFDA